MKVTDYLALHASLQPKRIAVTDLTRGQSWDYQAFNEVVSRYATLLSKRVKRGDRVAAIARNCPELVFLHLACARIGAIYVPLNWRLAPAEIQRLIEDANPAILLVDSLLAGGAHSGQSLADFAVDAARTEAKLLEPADSAAISLILYTSGTSGEPKGVLLSEDNLWRSALNFAVLGRVNHDSVVLCDTPMFHVIGLVTNVRPALMFGGRILVSDGFIASRSLGRLSDRTLGITHYFCVPQMARMLRAEPTFDPKRLRHLTAIFSGGAPHSIEAIRAWTADGITMADGFGMSEAGTVSCMPLDIDSIELRAGSVGVVAPAIQLRVVDEEDDECPTGQAGEMLLKGESITRGYWHSSKASSEAFTEDGWLRTGDIARVDGDGYLWLIDRKKDMFISGGENVYPGEIEAAMASHPAIAECAVIGVPDDQWGEVGHLFVVPAGESALNIAEIISFLAYRLASFKVPKSISILEAMPRNPAGKVVKTALRSKLPLQRP